MPRTAPAPPTLRLNDLYFPVTTLGPGIRLGIWVQGCALACHGCMARDTWDPGAGRDATVEALVGVWEQALDAGADGLTVSGGEPLAQPAALAALLARVAEVRDARRPDADILVYTGHATSAALGRDKTTLRHADAVITGRYVESRPTSLVWRGSDNQELLALTPRGTSRYEPHLHRTSDRPAIQLTPVGDGRVRIIGVPRAGDLPGVEDRLRALHVTVAHASWRAPTPSEE